MENQAVANERVGLSSSLHTSADRVRVFSKDIRSPDEFMTRIVRAATLAISGDNSQPWRFVQQDRNTLRVELDLRRDQSAFNPDQICSAVAVGAAIENAVEGAKGEGYDTTVSYFSPDLDQSDCYMPVALLRFRKGEADRLLSDMIVLRCSNRRKYSKQRIPHGIVTSTAEQVRCIPGMDFRVAIHPDAIRSLSNGVFTSDRVVFERTDMRRYLNGMIRWSKEEAVRTGDGMPADSFEVSRLEQLALRIILPLRVSTLLGLLGGSCIFGLYGREWLRNSGGVGLVVGRDNTFRSWVDAGRAASRAMLSLTADGIATQAMMSGVLLMNQQFGSGLLDRRHKAMTEKVRKVIRNVFALEPGVEPLFMFRMGYAPLPSELSKRRPVESVFDAVLV